MASAGAVFEALCCLWLCFFVVLVVTASGVVVAAGFAASCAKTGRENVLSRVSTNAVFFMPSIFLSTRMATISQANASLRTTIVL